MSTVVVLQWTILSLYLLLATVMLACCDRALTRFWVFRHRSQLSLRMTVIVALNYTLGWIQFLNSSLGMINDLSLKWQFYDIVHWLITRIWLMFFLASLMTVSWRVTWHYTLSRYEAEKVWKSELQMKLNNSWMLQLTQVFKNQQRTMVFFLMVSLFLCGIFVIPTLVISSQIRITLIQGTGAVLGIGLILVTSVMVYQTSDMGNLYGSRDELTSVLVSSLLAILTSLAIDLTLKPVHFWNKISVSVRNMVLLGIYFYFSVHRSVQSLNEVEEKTTLSLTMDDEIHHKTESVQQTTNLMRRVLSNYDSFVLLTEHCVSEMSVEGILFIVWYMRAKQMLFVFLRDQDMFDFEAAFRHLDDNGLDWNDIDAGLLQNISGLTPEMIETERERLFNHRNRPSFLRYISDTRPTGGVPFKPKLPTMQQSLSEKTESFEYFNRASTLERLADPISNVALSLRNRYSSKSKQQAAREAAMKQMDSRLSPAPPIASPIPGLRSPATQTNSMPTVSLQTGKTHGKRNINGRSLELIAMGSPQIALSPAPPLGSGAESVTSRRSGNASVTSRESGMVIISEDCDEESSGVDFTDDEENSESAIDGSDSAESEIIGLKDMAMTVSKDKMLVDSSSIGRSPAKVPAPLPLTSQVSAQSGSYSSLATPSANKIELEDGSVSRRTFGGRPMMLVPSISNPTEGSPEGTPSGATMTKIGCVFESQTSESAASTDQMIPSITVQSHAPKPSLLDVLRNAQSTMDNSSKSKLSRSLSGRSIDESPGVIPFQRIGGKKGHNRHGKRYFSEMGKLIYLAPEVFADSHFDKLETVSIEDVSSALLKIMDSFVSNEGLHSVNVSNKARVSALKYRDRLSVIHSGDSTDAVLRSVSHSLRMDKKIKIIIRCIFCLDCVIGEVMRMMRTDSFQRFLLCEDYVRWQRGNTVHSVSPGLDP